jgi:polyphosphate kinase
LAPALEAEGFRFLKPGMLDESDRQWLASYYQEKVYPVLTPLAVDPSHPFPQLLNKSLNLITRIHTPDGRDPGATRLAIVQVPRVLPHLVRLPRPDRRRDSVFLSDLIGANLAGLFGVAQVEAWWSFRVTRNSELYIDEEEVSNVRMAVEAELHNRRKGEAVRLEVSSDCPEAIRRELLTILGLEAHDLYVIEGPIAPGRLLAILEGDDVVRNVLGNRKYHFKISIGHRNCSFIYKAALIQVWYGLTNLVIYERFSGNGFIQNAHPHLSVKGRIFTLQPFFNVPFEFNNAESL